MKIELRSALEEIADGNVNSIEKVYDLLGDTVFSLALSASGDTEKADNAVSETLAALYTSAALLGERESPMEFVLRIAVDCINKKIEAAIEEPLTPDTTDRNVLEKLAELSDETRPSERMVAFLKLKAGLGIFAISRVIGMGLSDVISAYRNILKKASKAELKTLFTEIGAVHRIPKSMTLFRAKYIESGVDSELAKSDAAERKRSRANAKIRAKVLIRRAAGMAAAAFVCLSIAANIVYEYNENYEEVTEFFDDNKLSYEGMSRKEMNRIYNLLGRQVAGESFADMRVLKNHGLIDLGEQNSSTEAEDGYVLEKYVRKDLTLIYVDEYFWLNSISTLPIPGVNYDTIIWDENNGIEIETDTRPEFEQRFVCEPNGDTAYVLAKVEDGKVEWRYLLGRYDRNGYYSANGRVFIYRMDRRGSTILSELDTENGEVKWSYDVGSLSDAERYSVSLALNGDKLAFVGTNLSIVTRAIFDKNGELMSSESINWMKGGYNSHLYPFENGFAYIAGGYIMSFDDNKITNMPEYYEPEHAYLWVQPFAHMGKYVNIFDALAENGQLFFSATSLNMTDEQLREVLYLRESGEYYGYVYNGGKVGVPDDFDMSKYDIKRDDYRINYTPIYNFLDQEDEKKVEVEFEYIPSAELLQYSDKYGNGYVMSSLADIKGYFGGGFTSRGGEDVWQLYKPKSYYSFEGLEKVMIYAECEIYECVVSPEGSVSAPIPTGEITYVQMNAQTYAHYLTVVNSDINLDPSSSLYGLKAGNVLQWAGAPGV